MSNLFGSWQVNERGTANHYFIAGKPLCGRPVKETGIPAPPAGQRNGAIRFVKQNAPCEGFCADCFEANWRRWANRGKIPGAVAA